MKRSKMFSLFVAMTCTFFFAGACLAVETRKTTAGAEETSIRTQPSGFQRVHLSDTRGSGLTVMTGRTIDTGQASEQIGPTDLRPDIFRVLAVLEHRTGDRRLLEKTKYKLTGMSETRLRLAISLSVRADDKSTGAETDIAFLLLAILIVFS